VLGNTCENVLQLLDRGQLDHREGIKEMATARLILELEIYETQKAEWLQHHRDEFVVLKERELIGFFPTFHQAYLAGVAKYGMETDFLVKRVVPQEPIFEVL